MIHPKSILMARHEVSHTYKPTDAIIFTLSSVTLSCVPRAWRLYHTESLHLPGQPVSATMSRDNNERGTLSFVYQKLQLSPYIQEIACSVLQWQNKSEDAELFTVR